MRKSSKNMRSTHRKHARKVSAAEKVHATHHKVAPRVASRKARNAHHIINPHFEEFRDAQVPDSIRSLAENNIAHTRELYERSKSALLAVLASWEKSFGAAGQGAVAFNRKIMDIVERNIDTGFDLATSFAGAKNLAEAMTSQAACWRRHFRDLNAQAEEVRRLAAKVTAEVAEPIKGKVPLAIGESAGRMRASQR
jgi:hypothetical protein